MPDTGATSPLSYRLSDIFPHVRVRDRGENSFFIRNSRNFRPLTFGTVTRIAFHSFMAISLPYESAQDHDKEFFPGLQGSSLVVIGSYGESGEECVFLSCADSVLFIRRWEVFTKYCRDLSIKIPVLLDID